MVKSSHPLAGKKVDCDGTPPLCGHNHHSGYNHAWGLEWELTPEMVDEMLDQGMDVTTMEKHIAQLIEEQNGQQG